MACTLLVLISKGIIYIRFANLNYIEVIYVSTCVSVPINKMLRPQVGPPHISLPEQHSSACAVTRFTAIQTQVSQQVRN